MDFNIWIAWYIPHNTRWLCVLYEEKFENTFKNGEKKI